MAIEKLLEDLLMDILSRLPVETLLRSKSVCKYWYALIRNPIFISLHHDRASCIAAENNTDCLLVKRFVNGGAGLDGDRDTGDIALSWVGPNQTPIEDIDISSTGIDMYSLQLLGPCNGVVCLTRLGYHTTIALWNPAVREFRVIPPPSHKQEYMSQLGFGFDFSTGDYKLVRFGYQDPNFKDRVIDDTVEIYDTSTDCWREADTEVPSEFCCDYSHCTSWNGDFFWYAYRRYASDQAIMAFNMTNEEFDLMPVPDGCLSDQHSHSEKKLFVLNDSLAVVAYPSQFSWPEWFTTGEFWLEKSFDIWVMDDDGFQVSWTKIFTVGPFQGLDWALGFRQNGDFLLENGLRQMMSYNLYTQERKEYQVYGGRRFPPFSLQVLLYTESLVSVKRHNGNDGHDAAQI